MDKFVGKRLDGRYELREVLGVGGMAVVYKAYDNIEKRIVAVKILKEEYISNEEFIRRFRNESKAIAVLSHPNVVKVFDVSFGENIQYIVMEYIDGKTLKEYIEEQGSLRWKDAVHFTIQILRGLQHAHDKGIIHRDVKPQNIIVLEDKTIKVTDFGIARFARSDHKTITDKAIGSVHYISPEQARGEVTDEKADIYSVGVILYEMLTGQLPFQAESAISVAMMQLQREPELPTSINGSIPLGLEQITMHAMQKSTERRYKSASEMLCDLEKFKKDPSETFDYNYYVDEEPTKYVDTVPEVPQQANEKSPVIPVIAGIAVAFVCAIIILLAIFIPKLIGNTGGEIECPSFVGKTWEEVCNNPEYKNVFRFKDSWEYNSEYEKGVIYGQSASEGKRLKSGAEITLYISSGEKTKKVPNVNEYSQSLAISTLKADGFKITVVETTDEDISEGLVIKTSPAGGSPVAEGAEVVVYVSTGKPLVPVDLPDLVGLSKADALKRLEEKGLNVGTVTERDNTTVSYKAGVVMSQSPSTKNTKQVGKGSAVDIVLSTGKFASFNINLHLKLPENYKSETAKISVWQGTKKVLESEEINLASAKNYKLSFASSIEKNSFTVKLNSDEYLTITTNGTNAEADYSNAKYK